MVLIIIYVLIVIIFSYMYKCEALEEKLKHCETKIVISELFYDTKIQAQQNLIDDLRVKGGASLKREASLEAQLRQSEKSRKDCKERCATELEAIQADNDNCMKSSVAFLDNTWKVDVKRWIAKNSALKEEVRRLKSVIKNLPLTNLSPIQESVARMGPSLDKAQAFFDHPANDVVFEYDHDGKWEPEDRCVNVGKNDASSDLSSTSSFGPPAQMPECSTPLKPSSRTSNLRSISKRLSNDSGVEMSRSRNGKEVSI